MASSITIDPPAVRLSVENAAGNVVALPVFPAVVLTFAITRWGMVTCTPTGTTSSADIKNGTSATMGTPVIDTIGVLDIVGGKLFFAAGKKRAAAVTDLLDNVITVSAGATEIGRLYVDATTQKVSWFMILVPGTDEDARINLNGTNDINITQTTADPALELQIFVAGGD